MRVRSGFVLLLSLLGVSLTVRAAPDARVLELAAAEKPALVQTLRELVEIESGSRDLEGLRRLADLIAARLTALGGRTEIVDVNGRIVPMHDSPPAVGPVVVSRFTGTGTRRILLIAHMDTVYPRGTLAKRPWRVEGKRAYGPGVADDKGGIALILHTLRLLSQLDARDYGQLTVAINGDEEISTPGARELITQLGAEHEVVLSCEPHPDRMDVLAITTAGIAAATLDIKGRAAHAGVDPERGRNALVELSHQILQTSDLSRPETGLKFNWTVAQSGTTRNVIPDHATAAADVRVRRIADYDGVEREFIARTANRRIPDIEVKAGFEKRRPPLEVTAANRALAERARGIYAELGRKLHIEDQGVGGGTDAAFAALSGKPAVVEAFGLAGFGYHSSSEEYVDLDSVEPRLYLLTQLIRDLSRSR